MYLEKLEDLSRYLLLSDDNLSDLCKFLTYEIFSYVEPRAIYFAKLTDDGSLEPTVHHGFKKGLVETWGSFPLTLDIPLTAAVKQNKIVCVHSPEDMWEKFPITKDFEDQGFQWGSILSIPIPFYGAYSITTFKSVVLDADHGLFLRAIGHIVAYATSNVSFEIPNFNRNGVQRKNISTAVLSARQLLIKKLIEKGLTNSQIGDQIGFSESLVRQESMAIYAFLNVAGRKELLENSGGVDSQTTG